MSNSDAEKSSVPHHCSVRLFVSGEAQNSRKARENLGQFCERLPEVTFEVKVVDVNVNPQAALDQGVYLTPALQVIEPQPGLWVYGDLSDLSALHRLFSKSTV